MGFESDHARALSQSLHNLSIASEQQLPPSIRKSRQQRSASNNQTFVTTAVVPAADSTEILSSLINSLAVLSDSARDHLRKAQDLQTTIHSSSTAISQESLFTPNITDQDLYRPRAFSGPFDDDGDIAEAPVVGYARGRPKTPKKSTKEKWAIHRSGKTVQLNLSREPIEILRAPGSSAGIGVPSIERPGTSATTRASYETTRTVGSMRTVEKSTKSPLKMFFSSRNADEYGHTNVAPRENDARSVKTARSYRSSQHARELSRNPENSDAQASTSRTTVPQVPPIVPSSPENTKYNPLLPANREDLGEHMIPSRGSSLRHSPGRPSSHGRSSVTSRRPSTGGRDRKFTNTDPLPIDEEEEDSTVRRIRELQKAREKRQTEWLKESRSPEAAPKRVSVPETQKRHASSKDGVRQSVGDELAQVTREQPDQALPPTADKVDIFTTSTIVGTEAVIPIASQDSTRSTAQEPSKGVNILTPDSQPVIPGPRRHKRVLSGSMRRSSSFKQRPSDEVKNVSEQVETFLDASRLTQRVRHPRTGRTIAFSEVGDPEGFVVFVCVGMGLTRYITCFYDDVARTQKLRLITPDRPGIGESSPFPDGTNTPLAWVDDVAVICHALNIERFSLLAHSAGAIYALATALKMPQYVRGKIHLLAPWIPPSQMTATGDSDVKVANLPTSHKLLSMLPTSFLKAANSRFLSANAIDNKNGRKKDRQGSATYDALVTEIARDSLTSPTTLAGRTSAASAYNTPPASRMQSPLLSPSPSGTNFKRNSLTNVARKITSPSPTDPRSITSKSTTLSLQDRAALYDRTLTHRTWTRATTNANPAVDLVICLERRRPIGFLYTHVTRSVVIHHGRNDTRVPLETVRWLETVMKRCELQILDNEGHGLMASATVMSNILAEVGREWEEWDVVNKDKERRKKVREGEKNLREVEQRKEFFRTGGIRSY